jgi:predicted transcriptional regulator
MTPAERDALTKVKETIRATPQGLTKQEIRANTGLSSRRCGDALHILERTGRAKLQDGIWTPLKNPRRSKK